MKAGSWKWGNYYYNFFSFCIEKIISKSFKENIFITIQMEVSHNPTTPNTAVYICLFFPTCIHVLNGLQPVWLGHLVHDIFIYHSSISILPHTFATIAVFLIMFSQGCVMFHSVDAPTLSHSPNGRPFCLHFFTNKATITTPMRIALLCHLGSFLETNFCGLELLGHRVWACLWLFLNIPIMLCQRIQKIISKVSNSMWVFLFLLFFFKED